MGRLLDQVFSSIEKAIMLSAYLTIILVVGLETIRRMITGEQASWGPEIAMGAFVWLSWFAMASGVKSRSHLSFTTFRNRMPYRFRQMVEVFDCFLWFIIGAVVMVASWDVVLLNERFNQNIFGTDLPMALISIAVPLGWGFTMVRVFQQLLAAMKGDFGSPEIAAEDIR